MEQNILFIGLGHMGYPMASCLARAGKHLIIKDVDNTAIERFTSEHPGSTAFSDELAKGIDTVITMLPNSDIVENVLLGTNKNGLVSMLKSGTVIIDMSSSEPLRTSSLSKLLKTYGITLIDAPVSGGVKKAIDGSLAIMMGGDEQTVTRQKSLMELMGKKVVHVGITGAGHAAKALNNYVSAAGLLAVVDALHIGENFGIDPSTLVDVFNASSGRNNTTENKVKQYMLNGQFNSGFALNLMVKDIGIAMNLGKDLNYSTKFGEICLNTWKYGAQSSDKTADHTEMYRFINGDNDNGNKSAA